MQAFQHLPLRTTRLTLRPLGEADIPVLYDIHSNPQVMKYWDATLWKSEDRGRALVARDLAQRNRDYLRLGLELTAGGQFLGTCALWHIDTQHRRTEVGYALGAPAWGQGYMQEALTALLDYGFKELDLNRIEADTDPRNVRSARLLERLVFRQEGLFRERCIVEGEVSDSAMFGLLCRDWLLPRKL